MEWLNLTQQEYFTAKEPHIILQVCTAQSKKGQLNNRKTIMHINMMNIK